MRFLLFFVFVTILSSEPLFAQEQDNLRLQQQQLLSREKQAEIMRQEARIAELELQEKRFEEQKRQLLELQVARQDQELKDERSNREAISLEAKYREALKDRFITTQEANIRQGQRRIIYLSTISVVILSAAIYILIIQRRTRRLNARISEQHEELVQLVGVKDRLLTIVGHDMRSPVNMLLGLSQLLQDEDVSAGTIKQHMSQLESTLNHTSSMMDNLLYWASTQMQGYRAYITPVNLAEIAADVIKLQETQASRKGLNIRSEVPSNPLVLCDYDMISLVIRNLVSNAIKFTPAGGEILVTAEKIDDAMKISVRDSGVGMSSEQIAHFNSPAINGVTSTRGTNAEKGTGLGLLLCKSFIRLMDGQISAAANINANGNTFQIRLPYA